MKMRIIDFKPEPITEYRFLNAGRRAGQFYIDRLPVHHAIVDRLPEGLSALIVTADLQGRETLLEAAGQPLRLLGEVLPQRLAQEVLPSIGLDADAEAGVLLAGDFYTVPALDRRGGSGDVRAVWNAFGQHFVWVAGVAGNHDTFGADQEARPSFSSWQHYLDGESVELGGFRFGGVGGVIGNPAKIHRRTEDDYLSCIDRVLENSVDVLVLHDGPDGNIKGQRGVASVRELLRKAPPCLVVRGHAHWDEPFAEFSGGLQVLNVDARVVVMTAT